MIKNIDIYLNPSISSEEKNLVFVTDEVFRQAKTDQLIHGNHSFAYGVDRTFTLLTKDWSEKYRNAFRIIDDNYNERPMSFLIHVRSFFAQTFDDFILQYHQHGFIRFLERVALSPKHDLKHKEEGPQVLNMEKLSAGFLVWVGSVIIACLVFILEHLVFQIRKCHHFNEVHINAVD